MKGNTHEKNNRSRLCYNGAFYHSKIWAVYYCLAYPNYGSVSFRNVCCTFICCKIWWETNIMGRKKSSSNNMRYFYRQHFRIARDSDKPVALKNQE